jgi:hypothetical protein
LPQDDDADADDAVKSHENKKALNTGWRVIVVAAVVAAVAIVGVGFLYIKESERVAFITVNTLSLLVLVAIAVQAYIYRKQWEAMGEQRDAMKEQAGLMRDSLAETRKMAEQNERVVSAVEIQAKAAEWNLALSKQNALYSRIDAEESLTETRKLVIQNERTAQAMERAIDESKISREIENRAFVGVENVCLNLALKGEGQKAVEAIFVNVGKTPALNATAVMNVIVGEVNDPAHQTKDTFSYKPSSGVLLPNTKMAITRHVYHDVCEEAVNNHLENLIVWGVVRYEDVFRNSRETRFCFFNTHKSVVGFTVCTIPSHNAVE